jgi:hypothetical protein
VTDSDFLPLREVERFLTYNRPDIREIVLELRDLVWQVCPYATERILWGGLAYHNSAKGGPVKGAICQIELEKDRVRLAFIHGVRLTDPQGLLRGDRRSKRHLVVKTFEDAPWDEMRELIQEAADLDPTTFGPLGTG